MAAANTRKVAAGGPWPLDELSHSPRSQFGCVLATMLLLIGPELCPFTFAGATPNQGERRFLAAIGPAFGALKAVAVLRDLSGGLLVVFGWGRGGGAC